MIDVDSGLQGDVTDSLVTYTTAANRQVVDSFVQLVLATDWAAAIFRNELKKVGLSTEQYIDLLARHPDGVHGARSPDA